MKVLITGAAGLYGIHLVDELVQRADISRIIGVDDFSRPFFQEDPFIKSQGFDQKFVLLRKKFYDISIEEFDEMGIDVVIHLAAHISIPESMEQAGCLFS